VFALDEGYTAVSHSCTSKESDRQRYGQCKPFAEDGVKFLSLPYFTVAKERLNPLSERSEVTDIQGTMVRVIKNTSLGVKNAGAKEISEKDFTPVGAKHPADRALNRPESRCPDASPFRCLV